MNTHIFVTRRARNLPLSSLNRPRRSRWVIVARLVCVAVALLWLAALASLAWLIIR
jgi:hypothetical protein